MTRTMTLLEFIESRVKGISHYQDAAQACASGDAITLVPDPGNSHDSNAVRVEHQGNLIGHLDRTLAADLHELVKQSRVKAKVKEVLGGSGNYSTGINLLLEVNRPKEAVAVLERTAIEPLLTVLSGPVLGSHQIDDAVDLGAIIELLRQKIQGYAEQSCTENELGAAAQRAYEKYRFELLPSDRCPDALRITGVSALILGDRGMGVFCYHSLHSLYNTEVPQHVLKLLSVLQLHFSPTEDDVVPLYQSDIETASEYCTGKRRPKDLDIALHLVKRQLSEEGRSELSAIWDLDGDGGFEPIELPCLVFRALADSGEELAMSAMFNLGVRYGNGKGVEQDDSQAVHWYQKAADLGDAPAMCNLGFYYAQGKGVEQDDSQAVHWYQKAADLGDAHAMYNLGFYYAQGKGVEQDYSQAIHWYQKAADLGDAPAMYNLGVHYDNGEGVEQDDSQAVHWYQKAADLGYAEAKKRLQWIADAPMRAKREQEERECRDAALESRRLERIKEEEEEKRRETRNGLIFGPLVILGWLILTVLFISQCYIPARGY